MEPDWIVPLSSFVKLGASLSPGAGDISDSLFQVLMREIHDQDEKISVIEANTKLDHKDLVSKILRLEEKLKDSDYKQKKWEKTIEDMNKIIKKQEIKPNIINKYILIDEYWGGGANRESW